MKKVSTVTNPLKKLSQHSLLKQDFGSFWFWAAIRIVIVLLIVLGAFVAGLNLEQYNTMNWGLGEFSSTSMRNTLSCKKPGYERVTKPMMPMVMPSPTVQEVSIMNTCMKDMKNILSGKSGENLDRAFLENMIVHHQAGLDMAEYLVNAKHPELKKLGLEMIKSQKKELDQMKKWQKEWKLIPIQGQVNPAINIQTGTVKMF